MMPVANQLLAAMLLRNMMPVVGGQNTTSHPEPDNRLTQDDLARANETRQQRRQRERLERKGRK